MLIDGVTITTDFYCPEAELKSYVEYVKERVPDVDTIRVTLRDDDTVDLTYLVHREKFERIRRITGYLVGTTDRWNDSKKAEESDRVKHS